MLALGAQRQEKAPTGRLAGLAQAEEEDVGRSRWGRSGDDDGSAGKSDEGPEPPFPLLP